jgi:hypothetical protein
LACPAFGGWDPGNGRPLKRVPERKLQVEFWVEPIETAMNQENFQFDYLSTDQVRFVNADGEPIALEDVDPVLFSELMRDGDLFVGVAVLAPIRHGAIAAMIASTTIGRKPPSAI